MNMPKGTKFNEYKLHLEQLSSYVVVRGEVKQLHEMNEDATPLDPPRDRVIYYATFPKLQSSFKPLSKDFTDFCKPNGTNRKWSLKSDKEDDLKNKFKDVIRLQARVAAHNKEGLDIVTPNAFLEGLTLEDQIKAKKLFAKAVVEVASEPEMPGFKGFFVHSSDEMGSALSSASSLNVPIVMHDGDASSPQLAGQGKIKVSETIMGEGCGAVGNGALGSRANKAKEENDTRMLGGFSELIFNPNCNKALLNKNRFKALSSSPLQSAVLPKSPNPTASSLTDGYEVMGGDPLIDPINDTYAPIMSECKVSQDHTAELEPISSIVAAPESFNDFANNKVKMLEEENGDITAAREGDNRLTLFNKGKPMLHVDNISNSDANDGLFIQCVESPPTSDELAEIVKIAVESRNGPEDTYFQVRCSDYLPEALELYKTAKAAGFEPEFDEKTMRNLENSKDPKIQAEFKALSKGNTEDNEMDRKNKSSLRGG
ncbi:MAG: hypothetical protein HON32_04705 [Francisellaceae bacterium]|nr:hypothetical protein [Francisellaceae bacterium]MBT6539085.1 hypothetical protein [Francisellaceae bacterium]